MPRRKQTDIIAPIMKSNRLLAAPLSIALLLGSTSAFAQPAPPAPPAKIELAPLDKANWRAIAVKNARPSLIAWQLDPGHNKLPVFLNVPYKVPPKYAADFKQENRVKGPFDLPDNLRLAASDEQNLLFVAGGNAEDIAQLQELVAILDQPTRFVELEAQLVELPIEAAKEFGIAFNAATPDAPTQLVPGAFQIGVVRNDFQKRLDDLLADNKARVISTKPQIITNNTGLAVSLRFGPIDNTGAGQNKMPVAPAQGSDTIITLTPTINGDDTITVLMNLATLPENINSAGLTTIANLRDGDTIALTGLKSSAFPSATKNFKVPLLGDIPLMGSTTKQKVPLLSDIPMIGHLFRTKKPEDERAVLVFVTARIVG